MRYFFCFDCCNLLLPIQVLAATSLLTFRLQVPVVKSEETIKSEGDMSSLESDFGGGISTVEQVSVCEAPTTSAAPATIVAPSLPSLSTRSRSLDIFTTALASANINLDSFMEEEDGKCFDDFFV